VADMCRVWIELMVLLQALLRLKSQRSLR
jgi:hypothetical protein